MSKKTTEPYPGYEAESAYLNQRCTFLLNECETEAEAEARFKSMLDLIEYSARGEVARGVELQDETFMRIKTLEPMLRRAMHLPPESITEASDTDAVHDQSPPDPQIAAPKLYALPDIGSGDPKTEADVESLADTGLDVPPGEI